MPRIADYVVVYDITADREREKVDTLLKGFGFRVQKSVFECRLSRPMYQELVRRLDGLPLKTGFVRIYRLDYSSRKKSIGQGPPDKDDGYAFIV